MRSFISSLVILVVLLFTSVACTVTETPQVPGQPKLTIKTCETLPATGGEYSLSYTISNPVEGQELQIGEPSADWLHDVAVTDNAITFVYDENSDMPGSEPREASFTVTYAELEPQTVVVKQESFEEEFTVTFSNITPMSVDVTCVAKDPEMRFVIKKLTAESLAEYESKEAWAEYYISGRIDYWYENSTFTGSFPTEGLNNTFNFYESDMPAYVAVFGFSYTSEWENLELATRVYLYEPPLLPTPVLNVAEVEKSVSSDAGEASFGYTLENPIEGETITVETTSSWVTTTVSDDSIVVAYEANSSAKDRSATLTCKYLGADDVTLTLTQSGNTDAEPITFELTVLESHYDHILVDVTPSDATTKYAVGAISMSDFEGYPYYCSDEVLMLDLVSTYNKPTIVSGALNSYVVPISASDYTDWEWYVFVYAVDDSETIATSTLNKSFVEVVNDTPELSFEVKKLNVPAEGGYVTVKYTITNAREGSVVAFNGTPMNYYDVIQSESLTIDTEKCEVSFYVNPYDKEKYGHDATIFIAYYVTADSIYSDATASLKIEQDAPMQ